MQLVRHQGQENLPRAAQLANLAKMRRTASGSRMSGPRPRPILRVPDVTDRHADPQLAAPRLGSRRIVHPGAQDAEFELADAALHSQQEPVVRAARVINPVEINDAGAHKTAELQQVMPVAPVAGEPEASNTAQRQHPSPSRRSGRQSPAVLLVRSALDRPQSPFARTVSARKARTAIEARIQVLHLPQAEREKEHSPYHFSDGRTKRSPRHDEWRV